MKIIDKIKKKIALRRERKAKLRKWADLIEFSQCNGHSYIDLSESLISRKALSANGVGDGAFLPYIWKDKEGNVIVDGNLIVNGSVSEHMSDIDLDGTNGLYSIPFVTCSSKNDTNEVNHQDN